MFLKSLLISIILVVKSNCDTKVWIYSTEIYDPKNWVDGKIQKDCNGLVFAEINHSPAFINQLQVKQLVLPRSGTVKLEEGSRVVFDEKSQDDLNCVQLKSFGSRFVADPDGWKNLNNPDNPAVPYFEIPPCRYDDVVIPKGFNSSLVFSIENFLVKSVTFGNRKLNQGELNDIFNSDLAEDVFTVQSSDWNREIKILFKITGEECQDPTGCDRRALRDYLWYIPTIEPEKLQCGEGIVPYANMFIPICGAQIIIKTLKNGFTIDKINKKLKEYGSYTHASKYDPERKIQIIFTEKKFTGSSLIEATEFYNILQEDDSYFCEDIMLRTSGLPLNESNSHMRNAVSIIFGTLLGVIVIFGLLFLVYSPTVINLNLRNRFLSTRPLSTYILRYDNIEDRADIIDGQSLAGSVISLNRSFENPLYEHAPSTRSTSNETVISPKLEKGEKDSNEVIVNQQPVVLESAKELEDIDLHKQSSSEEEIAWIPGESKSPTQSRSYK